MKNTTITLEQLNRSTGLDILNSLKSETQTVYLQVDNIEIFADVVYKISEHNTHLSDPDCSFTTSESEISDIEIVYIFIDEQEVEIDKETDKLIKDYIIQNAER